MRRKPSQNNNYGQKRRHSQGGGRGPAKRNYAAAREKYLAQARDAMASGDRVMAEYYYQHAEHCFRVLAEESARAPRQQQQNNQQGNTQNNQAENKENNKPAAEEKGSKSREAAPKENKPAPQSKPADELPAFITSGPAKEAEAKKQAAPAEPKE